MAERLSPTLRAVSDAVLAVAAEVSVDDVLQRLVDSSRELAGARYAALGLPDGEGGFRRFLTSGMSDELIASLGPLPRQHGMLGAMLDTTAPYRTSDIHEHPRFRGWWPRTHPDMRSFLGVPIVAPAGVIGAFYLTEKLDGRGVHGGGRGADRLAGRARGDRDRERAPVRADAGALDRRRAKPAGARPPRRRQPEAVRPRARGRGGGDVLERDPAAAGDRVAKLQVLAREALEELRSLVFELRPPDLEKDGLGGTLRKHVEVLGRLGQEEIELDAGRRAAC